jgi:hypothetical protein
MGAELFADEQRRLEVAPATTRHREGSRQGGGVDELGEKWDKIQAAGQRRQQQEGGQKQSKFAEESDPAAEQRKRMGLDELDDDEYLPWTEGGGGTKGGDEGLGNMDAVQQALKRGMSKGPMAVQMSYRRKYVNKPGDYRLMHRKRVHAVNRREVEWKKRVHAEMREKKREKAAEEYQKNRWKELEGASAKMKRQRDESVKKDQRAREQNLQQSREATAERRAKEKHAEGSQRAHFVKSNQLDDVARKEEERKARREEKEAKEREAASVRAEKKAKAEELRLRREANIRRKEEERERALVERARALQAREVPSACKPNWLPPPPPSVDEQQATGVRINRRRSSAGPPLQTIKSLAVAAEDTKPRMAGAVGGRGGEVQVVLFEGEMDLPDVREGSEIDMQGGYYGEKGGEEAQQRGKWATRRCCMVRVLEVRSDKPNENSGGGKGNGGPSSWRDAGTLPAVSAIGKAMWLRVVARPLSMLRRERLAALRSDHGGFSSLLTLDIPLNDELWSRLSGTRHASSGGDKLVKQAQKLISGRPGASISATLSDVQIERLVEALVEELGVSTGWDAKAPQGLCLLPAAEDGRRGR